MSKTAIAVLLLSLLAPPIPARAAAPPEAAEAPALADREPFSLEPGELRAAVEALRPEDATDGVVLLYETRFTFDERGAVHYVRRRIFEPLSSSFADAWEEVGMNWSPWHQERPTVRARVVASDGRVHRLDPETLTEVSLESSLPDVYQDRRQLLGPLPAVAPGSVVEEVIEVVDREPLFPPGTFRRQFLGLPATLVHGRVVLEAPESLALRWTTGGLPEDVEPVVERAGGRVRVVFDVRDLPADEEAPLGLPPESPRFPYVAFSTGESWNAVARSYAGVVDRQIAAGGLDGEEVDPRAGSKKERIAAAVAWLHERVRYTGVELGDAAIVPRSPREVLARRYGDCKDKATLLVSLLRRHGIPADVVLLRAGSDQDVEPDLPGLTGLGGFNHAIVHVPGEPEVWIDPTDPYTPPGELPVADQGRLALVAHPETRELVRLPAAGPETNRIVETREVFLAEFGGGRIVETSELTGAPARALRADWADADEKTLRETLEGYVENTYQAESLGELEVDAVSDPTRPLWMRLEAERAGGATTDLAQAVVIVARNGLLQELPLAAWFEPDDTGRTEDFLVEAPHEIVWSYTIHLPPGIVPRDVPSPERRELGPAVYSAAFETEDDAVRGTVRFRLEPRRITAAKLEELQTEVAAFLEEGPLLLWFDQVGWTHLSAGRVGEAIEEFRRLARLHPDEALHRIQLALAVLEGGLVAEGRRQARAAVEMDPDDALAHHALALTLRKGPLGRDLSPGFDRESAIEAMRRAWELEPDNVEFAANLAVVLEHDASGERYRDRQGLEEAIEVYREVQDELDGTGFENNLPIALLRAERPDEALELLEARDTPASLTHVLIAALALAEGPEAAVGRADRELSGDQALHAQTLAQAGFQLLTLRRYPEAASLLQAASRSAPNPAQLLSAVRILEGARKHEELAVDPETPEGFVVEYVRAAVAAHDEGHDRLRSFLARTWTEALDPELLDGVLDELTDASELAPALAQGMSLDVIMDLAFAVGELTSRELPGLGVLVKLVAQGAFATGEVDDGALVVREDGELRLAAFEEVPGSFGWYALHLAGAGDPEGARAALDHAAEITGAGADDEDRLLASEAFHDLWSPEEEADRPGVELAAAVLALDAFPDPELVTTLRRERARTEDPAVRRSVDVALAHALSRLERWEELLEVGRRIEESGGGPHEVELALVQLGRGEEILERLEVDLEDNPDNVRAATRRVTLLMELGRLEEAAAACAELVDHPEAEAEVHNQAAWLAVLRGEADEEALEWAEQAAQRSDYASHGVLHTLATVQAELGNTHEAHRILLQAVEASPGGEPSSPDWYVLGRIAEHYGFPDAAAEYYRRTAPERGDDHPASTWALAQRRLAALDAPPPPAPRPGGRSE